MPAGVHGHEARASLVQEPDVFRMEAVDVLERVDRVEHARGVVAGRKRKLHEDAVHVPVGVGARRLPRAGRRARCRPAAAAFRRGSRPPRPPSPWRRRRPATPDFRRRAGRGARAARPRRRLAAAARAARVRGSSRRRRRRPGASRAAQCRTRRENIGSAGSAGVRYARKPHPHRMMLKAPTSEKTANVLVGTLLAVFALGTMAFGAFSGFPIQDDTNLVRLLRLGGDEGMIREHRDRPVVAFLVASCARLAGEHPGPYVAIALMFWAVFAALAACFWRRALPGVAAGLAGGRARGRFAAAHRRPVHDRHDGLPLPASGRPSLRRAAPSVRAARRRGRMDASDRRRPCSPRPRVAVSEYGLASAIACAVFLLLRGRRRGMWTLVSGAAAGYGLFRWIADVRIRSATDPQVQIVQLVSNPWPQPLRLLSAVWHCLAGAWGSGLGAIRLEWASKSTLVAALLAVLVAGVAAALAAARPAPSTPPRVAGRVIALVAAVVAGLVPVVIIQGWPFTARLRIALPAAGRRLRDLRHGGDGPAHWRRPRSSPWSCSSSA